LRIFRIVGVKEKLDLGKGDEKKGRRDRKKDYIK
jgi:hypothetical protein